MKSESPTVELFFFPASKHITTDDFSNPKMMELQCEMVTARLWNHPASRFWMQQGITDAANCLRESL